MLIPSKICAVNTRHPQYFREPANIRFSAGLSKRRPFYYLQRTRRSSKTTVMASGKTIKSLARALILIFWILISASVMAQSRPQPGNRPATGRPGNSRPPGGNRPPGTRPPVSRPPVTRPPVHHRPSRPVVTHPRPVHRPVTGHRPPGWAPGRRPYVRPPYVYRGRRFYSYHSYVYHPYRPFLWGPAWHPVGFYMQTMMPGAVVLSIHSIPYRYYSGVFYQPFNGGYRVVPAPPTVIVPAIPEGYESVVVDGTPYLYYGGTFYEQMGSGYVVSAPPAGAVISQLPAGCTVVHINGMSILKFGDTYFQPVTVNGRNMYEVIESE